MKELKEDSYINFKIVKPRRIFQDLTYVIMTVIKKDLTSYTVHIINIFPIFPLYTRLFNILAPITFGSSINRDVHIPMNEEIQNKISQKFS